MLTVPFIPMIPQRTPWQQAAPPPPWQQAAPPTLHTTRAKSSRHHDGGPGSSDPVRSKSRTDATSASNTDGDGLLALPCDYTEMPVGAQGNFTVQELLHTGVGRVQFADKYKMLPYGYTTLLMASAGTGKTTTAVDLAYGVTRYFQI